MKVVRRLLLVLFLIISFSPIKAQGLENTVNMYLFYSSTCPHCAALKEDLKDIKIDYPNLKVYMYEVSSGDSVKNNILMSKAATELGVSAKSVPFTIIGTRSFTGYSGTQTRSEIEYALKLYSNVSSYKDPIGKLLDVEYSKGTLTYDDIKLTDEENNGKQDNFFIDVPFIGTISAKTLSLPIVSILIGTIDGFNPCAMWVLLFLLSVLIGMKNRKRMWILGSAFLLTSAIIYLLFMLVWLNLTISVDTSWWKIIIALVALIGGIVNLKTFFTTKEAGCEVVDETKRKKTFEKIRQFTHEKSFPLALLGIMALAISVNFIEMSCSAGLPATFANILAINHLSSFEYGIYIFLYMLFFLLDDLIVFFIAMKSFKLTGISNKYGKYSHLVGGIIMVLIGILMILKPEWLMFNF